LRPEAARLTGSTSRARPGVLDEAGPRPGAFDAATAVEQYFAASGAAFELELDLPAARSQRAVCSSSKSCLTDDDSYGDARRRVG